MRILLAESFDPPFYPNLEYQPARALEIAKALNADSIRFPAAAYRAFFPTKTKYPRHPMLGDQDPDGETIELFHRAGLKVVVYLPPNHPFLPTSTATAELEYPDLYLRFPGSTRYPADIVPQDLQVLVVKSHNEAEVLALNFNRGRNRLEGPALIRRRSGAGEVIFIPSGLEAVYLETHAVILRELFEDLLAAWSAERLYELKAPAGVWGHLTQSPGHLVLHVVANTGNKWKKLQAREQFLPVGPIEARVRVPGGVKRAWQWSDRQPLPFRMENDYAAFRLPEIKIHEGLVLEFSRQRQSPRAGPCRPRSRLATLFPTCATGSLAWFFLLRSSTTSIVRRFRSSRRYCASSLP